MNIENKNILFDYLLNKGFYKIKCNYFSDFSKIISGIIWSINISKKFKLKLDIKLKEQKLNILEYKIRLSEKIHNYLYRVKSNIILLPYQISGLDLLKIFELIKYLLNSNDSTNIENEDDKLIDDHLDIKSYILNFENFRKEEVNLEIEAKTKKTLKYFHPIKTYNFLIKIGNYDYVDQYINIVKNDKLFKKAQKKLLAIIDTNKINQSKVYKFRDKRTQSFIINSNDNHKNILNIFNKKKIDKKIIKLKENIEKLKKSNNLIIKEIKKNPLSENININEIIKMYKVYKNNKIEILDKQKKAINLKSKISEEIIVVKKKIKTYKRNYKKLENNDLKNKLKDNFQIINDDYKDNLNKFVILINQFIVKYNTINRSTYKLKSKEKYYNILNKLYKINFEIKETLDYIYKILKPKKIKDINEMIDFILELIEKNM